VSNGLAGRGVVLTRPAAQVEPLARRIEQAGARVIRFPTLKITAVAGSAPLDAALNAVATADWTLFTSANAVTHGLSAVRCRMPWPQGPRVAAVGPSTARAIAREGLGVDLVPADRFDSEGLLAEPALADVAGRRIVIFRGEGGRELLGETLRARGAEVIHAECYRRELPEVDTRALRAAWRKGEVDVIVLTSVATFDNLRELLADAADPLLSTATFVAASQRLAARVRERYPEARIIVAASAEDGAIVNALEGFATG